MSDKAKRAVISIAGIEVEVFQLPTGGYVMSQTQAAEIIGNHDSSIRRFLGEKRLKPFTSERYESAKTPIEKDWCSRGNRQTIQSFSIDVASEYWTEKAFTGNVKAQALVVACMQEALQRRCDTVFNAAVTEQQYERQAIDTRKQWEQDREFLKDAHSAFTNACIRFKFNCAMAHDEITLAVCGKTAAQLRELEVIEGRSSIGLNHIADNVVLVAIAKVKIQFARYAKGSICNRIIRAIKDTKVSV
ncbi:hypothetical protein [Nostoc sp. C117]|uniref:hypothetical protein n=1 Tax=Nostoc sp. C117 TaxID=3349875 RepID=UPI00370DB739